MGLILEGGVIYSREGRNIEPHWTSSGYLRRCTLPSQLRPTAESSASRLDHRPLSRQVCVL
jgi:hypothetical protein